MIDRFERFSVVISEISRYWHKITTAEMEKYGLKGAHSVYLTAMMRFPEGVSANQLCDVCCKDKSDVSRMMAIMEQKGLVMKEVVHQNLYKGVFKLTDEGRAAAEFVQRRAELAVAIAGKDLTDETRSALYSALEAISANLRDISENGLPGHETDGEDE